MTNKLQKISSLKIWIHDKAVKNNMSLFFLKNVHFNQINKIKSLLEVNLKDYNDITKENSINLKSSTSVKKVP